MIVLSLPELGLLGELNEIHLHIAEHLVHAKHLAGCTHS